MKCWYCPVVLFSLLSLTGFSQQKKYQGLLWEISGNGLETPSYLYGTMHVSNKLAFNVSDSFYFCLDRVQGVALESSPANWIEDYRELGAFGGGNFSYEDFYNRAFTISEAKTNATYNLLDNKNSLMNQILYRFNPGNADYQESTFLDMFIYQAGAKNSKSIYSLETLNEVLDLSLKASTPDKDKLTDNNRNNYLNEDRQGKVILLEEAYRRGDLDQIDSLSKSNTPTSVYHDYFIVERNKNMVRRMDSIFHTNSLFIGIGAAHLPGDEGAIALLRNLGYKVRPVNPKSTGKSHKMRKKLESLYRPINFSKASTEDGFISVSVPGKLYQMPSRTRDKIEYLSPEPINGGYFSIVRQFTFGPIFNKDEAYYKATFDSLLYIATPGELIKKEDIAINGHSGYRILTKTSKNAYVNYNVFFTPTEIVVFKGFGITDYIQKNEPKAFFNNISLGKNHSNWNEIQPKFGGAKWKMKGLVTGQDMIDGLENVNVEPLYQSYDNDNGDYYLVMRYAFNDLDFIEEDSFDLAYLGERFGAKLDYEVSSSKFYPNKRYTHIRQTLMPEDGKQDGKKSLQVKIITKGGHYYLMTTTAQDENARTFFESFELTDFPYTDQFETYTDTNLYYTAETILEKEAKGFGGQNGYYAQEEEEEDLNYRSSNESNYHFMPKTGESIYVGYLKYNNYDGAESVKDFWDYRTKRLTKENGLIIQNKISSDSLEKDQRLSFTLVDTGSSKGIMTLLWLHHGVQYTVQSLIDTVTGPSEYVQRFFDTFKPMDTLIGRDIFENKPDIFVQHVEGKDSLERINAIKSIETIDFKEKDVSGITQVYKTYEFEEETEQKYREDLIMSLGNIEVQEAYDFLYGIYDSNNFNSDLQFIALKCFSYTETKEAYDAIKKLLLTNPPFTEKNNKLFFFDNLYDSLELSKNYFPEMLDLVQYPDYHPHIMELLATGYLEKVYDFNHFNTRKSSIFRNANIELKRTVANQRNKNESNYDYRVNNQFDPYHNLFLDYYTLMCGFKANGEKEVDHFFEDIYRIDDQKFVVESEIIHHKLGLTVDTAKLNEASRDIKYRVWVYNRLKENDMLSYFDSSITQKDMAYALLYNNDFDEEKDTVAFVEKHVINNGKEEGTVYFFKRKTEKTKNWMIDYVGMMPVDNSSFKTEGLETKKGLAVKDESETNTTIEKTIEIFEMKHRNRVELTPYNFGGLFDGLF